MTHSNQPQVSLRETLDNYVQDFLHDYIHGYENSKEQGLNLEYCTFDTVDAFLNDMEKLFEATAKEVIIQDTQHEDYCDLLKPWYNFEDVVCCCDKASQDRLIEKQLARLAALLRGEGEEL